MRIIAGIWRGRLLETPAGRTTRPTTDRTREALVSMLLAARDLELGDASVLDAFAGSGAIGFELLSRGAAHCTFVDEDRHALTCVRHNAAQLQVAGSAVHVLRTNAFELGKRNTLAGAPFDIVVLDPPYATDVRDVCDLVADLVRVGRIAQGALVVYERDVDAAMFDSTRIEQATFVRTREHGTTALDLIQIGGTYA